MERQNIFFDVDGTLLDSATHEFPQSAKAAIQSLKQAGYRVFIATGRCYASLKRCGLMDAVEWDGYVLSNGQVVMLKDQTLLHEECIDFRAVKQCIDISAKHQIALSLISSDDWFMMDDGNDYVKIAHQFLNEVLPPQRPYEGEPIITMLAYDSRNADYHEFRKIEGLKVIPAESTYADLIVEGVSKADGIKRLCAYFEHEDYIAFGDSLNDWEMMEHAALSIAMGQGNEKLKALADFVTRSVNEDGIAYAVNALGLLNETKDNHIR